MTSGRNKCIILAGGLGTRLRDAIHGLPKCLAPVGQRSFIELQIEQLASQGVHEIYLSLGHQSERVISALSGFLSSSNLQYVVEPSPLGTGGAISYAMNYFGFDEALIVNGDTFLDGSVGEMLKPLNKAAGELARIAVVPVEDRSRFGGLEMDVNGNVENFLEKGQGGIGYINAGLYRLRKEIFATVPTQSFSLETDVFPTLVSQQAIKAVPINGTFIDIGVPEDYRRFCMRFRT